MNKKEILLVTVFITLILGGFFFAKYIMFPKSRNALVFKPPQIDPEEARRMRELYYQRQAALLDAQVKREERELKKILSQADEHMKPYNEYMEELGKVAVKTEHYPPKRREAEVMKVKQKYLKKYYTENLNIPKSSKFVTAIDNK